MRRNNMFYFFTTCRQLYSGGETRGAHTQGFPTALFTLDEGRLPRLPRKNASQQHVRRHSSHDVGHHERTDHSFYAAEQAALAAPACGPALGLDKDAVLK